MKKKLLISLICCAALQISAFAAPAGLQNVIPQAGTINAHDLQNLKYHEAEQQIQEDYQNFEKQKTDKKVQSERTKKQKRKVVKAKVEDYATKGVYIENIEVSPSQILTAEEIKDIIDDYTQTNMSFEQLQEIVAKINKLYLEKGFVTARAYLPEQTIENETVKIELLEGKVGNVTITGNKWTRTSYIDKRLNLKEGDLFNLPQLEQDLMIFNRYNNNVELSGNLEPGKSALGTTDINIFTRENSPFHFTTLVDNAGRSTIGKYRVGFMLQDDSLLGYRDRLTLGTYVNKYSVTPFVDYNIPVNKKDGRIGFNFSAGNSKIGHGPYKMFNIRSRSQNYSVYYSQPIYRKPWTELVSMTSVSYKRATTSFDGNELYKDEVASAQTGLNFRYDTKRGIWYINQNVSYAFPLFDSNSDYLKIDGNILRLHDFGHGFVGSLRGNYQVIPNERVVPYIDQMIAGGVATVRGYSEGLLIGKTGYIISTELMFPIGPRSIKSKKDKEKQIPFTGNYLKGFIFADHAGIFPYKGSGPGSQSYNQDDFLASVGFGFKINLPGSINLRIAWGFPLMRNHHEEKSKCGRFHFELSLQPDIDALVRLRKPKNPENVKIDDDIKFADNKKDNIQEAPKRTVIKTIKKSKRIASYKNI